MYYRIFGTNDAPLPPEALLEHLRGLDFEATGHFKGDSQGWFQAELIYPEGEARLEVERFLASEEGIRTQLNTWAAWLEKACTDQPRWLQHMISTRQVITLRCVSEEADPHRVSAFCLSLCRFLATSTDGIYQIDGRGFFVADGTCIVSEV